MMKTALITGLCSLILATTFSPAQSASVLWIGDSVGNLGTVDATTGSVQVIGNMGRTMADIAFDPGGNLYGITFDSLYKIDRTTAAISLVGSLGTSANSMGFDSTGTLYIANQALYTVNPLTGIATFLGNGGSPYSSSGDLAFAGGTLFLSSLGSTHGDNLVALNTTDGSGALVGGIGFFSVFGLASPNGTHLYGVSGTDLLTIDPITGEGRLITNYAGHGLFNAYGSSFASEAAVPIPGSVWLLASGLFALLVGIRKPTTWTFQ
jgi:hypothetical protein